MYIVLFIYLNEIWSCQICVAPMITIYMPVTTSCWENSHDTTKLAQPCCVQLSFTGIHFILELQQISSIKSFAWIWDCCLNFWVICHLELASSKSDMSIPHCIATEFLDTLCQLYQYKIWISGQVLHCWSVVKTPCSIFIWYLIESLRHNVLCLQISSFRLACVLGIITVAVLNVFWCWAVLDVVPQIDTCTTGEISAKSLVLGDNNTQSSISSCTPTNITLLQWVQWTVISGKGVLNLPNQLSNFSKNWQMQGGETKFHKVP